MTNREVVARFVEGQKGKASSVISDGKYLVGDQYYSTKILAIRKSGQNLFFDGDWFLLNGDRDLTYYSHHTWLTTGLERNYPSVRIPFSCLIRAGIDPTKDQGWYILDCRDSKSNVRIFNTEEEAAEFIKKLPYFYYSRKSSFVQGGVEKWEVQWHVTDNQVLFYNGKNDSYWIAGLDDRNYFISRLPFPVYTLEEAFEALKPLELRRKNINFHRQGEWFFVRHGTIPHPIYKNLLLTKESKLVKKRTALPYDGGNSHVADRLYEDDEGNIFVIGKIKHCQGRTYRWSGEHMTLNLYPAYGKEVVNGFWFKQDVLWYRALRNTAIENYSIGGRID